MTENLVHSLDNESRISPVIFVVILVVALIIGVGGGYLLGHSKSSTSASAGSSTTTGSTKAAGLPDKSTFKDQAEGVLREGGINGEGSFHLERPGGESQNVYLTSTTVDLSGYVGKKVHVWGATFKGQSAGWLMDVGLVEALQ